jgi:hypothetical protein
MVPVKFKYCFGDKSPRTFFCNGTVLIVVDYRGGSSEMVHPGNPAPPLRKDRSALGERCVSLGPVRAGAALIQEELLQLGGKHGLVSLS